MELFLNGKVQLLAGDCREQLKSLPDNSVDSGVMDPPYALVSIVKRFGGNNAAPAQHGKDGAYARASAGFMGKQWDTGETAFATEFWAEVYRVLKPGAHLAAFSGTRTYHRMAVAIEDAGFELRDQIEFMHRPDDDRDAFLASLNGEQMAQFTKLIERDELGQLHWVFGVGFPKSHSLRGIGRPELGTALKPAFEPICLARKPLSEKTVAANVLRWGTGAVNVDATRIGADERFNPSAKPNEIYGQFAGSENSGRTTIGRFPANLIHDGSDEVVAGFPETSSGVPTAGDRNGGIYGEFAQRSMTNHGASSGSAARFFYSAKADGNDRLGSKHPTVKPVDLMQWLCRLITPPGGVVLDCFAGTGTTGEAAWREGFSAILMEREEEYQADIRKRMSIANQHTAARKLAHAKPTSDDNGFFNI